MLGGNGGVLLVSDASNGFSIYQHSSGGDFSAVISIGDGNFLLAGEDGVHRYPEAVKEEDADE